MYCDQCGHEISEGAKFCAECGAPVAGQRQSGGHSQEDTTAAIEIGAFDPQHDVTDLPELAAGTGMLVVVRGPNAGSRFLLDREATTVGRHPDSDIFLDDVTVSRRHAELLRTSAQMVVKDLGSLNGTYLNRAKVTAPSPLTAGDEVRVGKTVVEVVR